MPVELRDNMTDLFEKLLAGPNSVKELTLKDGTVFFARSGTAPERSQIQKLFNDPDRMIDAIAATVQFQVANEDGSRKFTEKSQRKFAETLDFDIATEIALAIRNGADDEDEMSIDELTEEHLKNSQSQKEVT